MKQKNKSLFWVFLALCTFGLYAPVQAQDDLYYDPATDAPAPTASSNSDDSEYREPSNITRRYDDDGYSDEDDDYAYQYSSRIRRFHRPAPAVDYYDPFFSDLYYYDPYFMPGNSIYTYGYNDYWTWRQWRRAQRWNSWYSWGVGPVWSSWGWNSCYNGYSPWSNPWAMNNYYYDPYWTWNGYNPYYGNGYGNNWVDNSYYYSNTGNGSNFQPKTYTGVRRHGSTVNGGYARIADNNGRMGRLVEAKNGPVLETRTAPRSTPVVTKGTDVIGGTGPSSGRTVEARESTSTTRRPDDRANNNGRNVEQPAERTRPSTETVPRRSESPAETRPSRRNDSETRPSRESETRPARTEERQRSNDRPARTEERSRTYDTPSRTQETRPSRNESRSNDNSSNNRSYDSGSSRSSSGSSGSSSGSSSGGRSSSGSSGSGGGSRGRN